VNDCEIARRLGVPRTTVRDWRHPRYVPRAGRARSVPTLLAANAPDRVQRRRLRRVARRRCFPDNRVGRVLFDGGSTVVLHVYSSHLSCLFPQAGPGKKHERAIVLEPWQARRVAAARWAFLRGCIRSDGCAFVNRTGTYEYLSYDFCNSSEEIRQLFVDACRNLGLACRPAGNRVRINHRASVALMLEHVGVKT
jgi:hypothetical protein